ncbi:MAG TPA: hypothetical protein P5268_08340 [Candidatus Marinimicrobia bacterium]|nr:hypothetical protein [Candidatus Neomarinimicrobiota bacterium]HRS51751.1 hypothetical protein [Candidatus Neomarinimicrobiota bacterium]HRU93022.1 hypothetical protein [Candidatus Neomarinimicrobiota bacterium]
MKNKVKIIELLFLAGISLLMIFGCGKVTSPKGVDIPENPKIKKINDATIEISWDYNQSDQDIIFTVARKVGDAVWNLEYAKTFDNFLVDTIRTRDSLVYAYKIKAASDTSELSSEFSEVVAYFSQKTTPTELTISVLASDTVEVSWKDNCIGEEGYKIEKKVSSGNWIKDYKTFNRNVTSFSDKTSFGDSVFYRVYAFSGISVSGSAEGFIVSTFPAPYNLKYEKLAIDKIKLTWQSKPSNIKGFKIDKKVGSESWQSAATIDTNQTWWIDEDAEINEILRYRIYGFSEERFSNYTETGEIDNTFPAPSNLTLAKIDEDIVKITWQDNSKGETGFYLDRKVGTADWVEGYARVDSNQTTLLDNISEPCGTFYYRVSAFKNQYYSEPTDAGKINVRLNLVSSLATKGTATEIFISDWKAYVADQYNGLVVIDLTNPSSPSLVKNLGLPDRTMSIYIYNGLAYATNHSGGLNIVDVNSLELIGSCQTSGVPIDVFVTGGPPYAYLCEKEKGVSIISILSSTPHIISNITPPNTLANESANKLFVTNGYAYVAYGVRGLTILDVSDVQNPQYVADFPTTSMTQDVFIQGNYAFLADGRDGLVIVDISNANAPALVSSCPTDGFVYSIFVRGDYAYLADKEKGLIVINITDLANPFILGSFEMSTTPNSVFVDGSYAFVTDGDGLKIIQIAP